MLSRLQTSSHFFNGLKQKIVNTNTSQQPFGPNFSSKRWSGHNAMTIEPSNYGYKHFKDMLHLYCTIAFVPIGVITAIINIRANPVLTEIPEGYEPREWEYYRHPISRFIARYLMTPPDLEHELTLAQFENSSESQILTKLARKTERAMKFYSDHRSTFFTPYFAERYRWARDDGMNNIPMASTAEGRFYEYAHDENITIVPVEGYKPQD